MERKLVVDRRKYRGCRLERNVILESFLEILEISDKKN